MQWENVYVFISSTFNDMHAERDYLVKKVFPQLSAWCARRKLRLVDIDLRWGVSEADATENKRVVQVCLDRIDECRPFFLCFLGQRRGWVPRKGDIGGETYEIYKKLEEAGYAGSASVTEMEILHALIDPLHGGRLAGADGTERELPAVEHAFFYLRGPDYLNHIADPHLKNIYTNGAEPDAAAADAELARWRDSVIPATGRPVTGYEAQWNTAQRTNEIAWPTSIPTTSPQGSPQWQNAFGKWAKQWQGVGVTAGGDGTITGQELEKAKAFNDRLTRGRLGNFSADGMELAERIISQMQRAITARFGEREEVAETPLQKELDQQAQFLHTASEGFIRRAGDFDAMHAYLTGPDARVMAVTAPAGTGKTSLLAHFIDTYHPAAHETLHYRFVGGSDQSATVDSLLRSLFTELKECGRVQSELPATAAELRAKFYTLLEEAGKAGKTILVIDALNQLESGMDDLAWLPGRLPEQVKLIVSFKRGEAAADAYYEEAAGTGSMLLHNVRPMADMEDRRKLVDAYLSSYFKELDAAREDMLISSAGADNPLFLKTVLSELRQFGSHQSLTEYIRDNFGDTPVTAADAVLRRMENDPPYASVLPAILVPHIFGWLSHAQQGLSVDELAALLVQHSLMDDADEAAEAVAVVLRQLRPYLAQRDGRTDFFYESFRIAARRRYTGGDVLFAKPSAIWHAALAAYFERQPFTDAHALMELAYQYAHAGHGGQLAHTLADYRFLDARLRAHGVDALAADFDLAKLPQLHLTAADEHILKLLQEFLILSTDVLAVNPTQLAQQLYGRLLGSPLPQVKTILDQAREVNRQKKQLWLRPCFPYMAAPGGRLRRMWKNTAPGHASAPVTPDGSRMVIKLAQGRFSLIDLDTGKVLKEFPQHTPGSSPRSSVTADGSMLFSAIFGSGDSKWIDVTDLRTGACVQSIHVENMPGIASLNVSDDGRRVFICAQQGDLIAYEKQDGAYVQVLREKSENYLMCGHLSRDGSIALVGGHTEGKTEENTVEIWDMDARARVGGLHPRGYGLYSMALAADNDTLLLGRQGVLELWSLKERREVSDITSRGSVNVDITPDGKMAACSDGNSVRVLQVSGMKTVALLERHVAFVFSVAISADGSRVVSGANDQSVRLWDVGGKLADHIMSIPGGEEYPFRQVPTEQESARATASADGCRLAIDPMYKAVITVHDTRLGVKVSELENLDGKRRSPDWLAVSARGGYVAALFGRRLRGFRVQPGETLFTTGELDWQPSCVAVLEEKRQALVGDEEGRVHVFDMDSGRETYAWQAHAARLQYMIASPGGELLATASLHPVAERTPADDADSLKTWNTADFSPHGYAAGVGSNSHILAFRPDGGQYATSRGIAHASPIILWDSETNDPQAVLLGHQDSMIGFAVYSRDGRWLAVGRPHGSDLTLFDTLEGKLAFRLYSSDAYYMQAWFTGQGDLAALCGDGVVHYFHLENAEDAVLPAYTPTVKELEFKAKLFSGAAGRWYAEKNFAPAKKDYEIAAQCYEALVEEQNQAAYTEMLAWVETQLGMCCGPLGENGQATEAYLRAAAWYGKLAASGEEKFVRSTGRALWNAAAVYAKFDLERAGEQGLRALAVREGLKDASEQDRADYETTRSWLEKWGKL